MPRSKSVESSKSKKDTSTTMETIDPFLLTFESEFPFEDALLFILGGIITNFISISSHQSRLRSTDISEHAPSYR